MTISYFGYGSLVNVETLNAQTVVTPGRLSGWRREWRIRGKDPKGFGVCSLTVVPEEGSTVFGVAASEPKKGLDVLQRREWKYDRIDGVGPSFRCDARQLAGAEDMFLFRAKPEHYEWGDDEHPILQSYVDCVLAGFHAFWGEAGVRHFMDTTHGWHVPILADRERPIYPRSVKLSRELRDLIDDHLGARKVSYLKVA